jgi:hypothetical protein
MGSELIKQAIVKKQFFIVNSILKEKLTMKRFNINHSLYYIIVGKYSIKITNSSKAINS